MRKREAPTEVGGDYRCRWSPYSALPGPKGEFRLLVFTVDASGTLPQAVASDSHGVPLGPDPSRLDAVIASPVAPEPQVTAASDQRYSPAELRAELRRFEHQLRVAGLKETSVTTYVDRTDRFLKWLEGDYQPRGPN